MSLNKQVHLYSVDTGAFYTSKEIKIDKALAKFKKNARYIKSIKKSDRTENQMKGFKFVNKKIRNIKAELKDEMDRNNKVRYLQPDKLNKYNIVSAFESSVTRSIGANIGELTQDIIIVQTYYQRILQDLIHYGFMLEKEQYVCFTASAGQIRTKKTVFMKKTVYDRYIKTFTCGLTVDRINEKGGINVNKFLAYLALGNSATDLWDTFDIDKSIVVEDFETSVTTNVDFIDEKTYEIKPNTLMDVLIPHTDGSGMMLPKVSKKAMMVRAPWIKGLLTPFRFNIFIKEHLEKHPDCRYVNDIYGKRHDILKDGIEIIFTKSQFKMWKYYDSWEDYKDQYKKHNCQAGKCNEEPDKRRYAKINYQMMQTLQDITTEELTTVASFASENIEKIAKDKDIMMRTLGADKFNENKTYLQESLSKYPELLQDHHCRETIKQMKAKLVKEGYSARLPIKAKYTFLIPDLYAFCENLFLGIDNPIGLLEGKHVSCKLFKENDEVDVLRSPHLYMEHAIRNNVNTDQTKRWFISDGIYTSTHDVISKILQFDVDGDQALVCIDPVIIEVAKRNSKGIVPLYYEMAKAENKPLNNQEIYRGLRSAHTGGNIGEISNDITKVWNSNDINKDVIKYLCMENNFVIDYAKTLYKPKRPDDINELIKSYTKAKVPAFFQYAKDKDKHRVEPRNDSGVNKLKDIIKDVRIKFDMTSMGKFDYTMLTNIPEVRSDEEIIDLYKKLNRYKGHLIKAEDRENLNNTNYVNEFIRNAIMELNDDVYYVVDVLVHYLFGKKTKNKNTFWNSFGDIALENLNRNLIKSFDSGYIMCKVCGDRVLKKSNKTIYCVDCAKNMKNTQNKGYDCYIPKTH